MLKKMGGLLLNENRLLNKGVCLLTFDALFPFYLNIFSDKIYFITLIVLTTIKRALKHLISIFSNLTTKVKI